MKKVLGCLRRACDEFTMIEDGDRIAVGLSGGKDSILLLYALSLYRQYRKLRYELVGITVDLGFQGFETAPIRAFLEGFGAPYHVVSTDISQVVFEIAQGIQPLLLMRENAQGRLLRMLRQIAGLQQGCLCPQPGRSFGNVVS